MKRNFTEIVKHNFSQMCGRYYEHSLSILSASNFTKWLRRSCASIMSITGGACVILLLTFSSRPVNSFLFTLSFLPVDFFCSYYGYELELLFTKPFVRRCLTYILNLTVFSLLASRDIHFRIRKTLTVTAFKVSSGHLKKIRKQIKRLSKLPTFGLYANVCRFYNPSRVEMYIIHFMLLFSAYLGKL